MDLTISEENRYLDISTARVDDEIQQLLTTRAHLRRRANALRDTTRILPPETLTTIFECAIHERDHPVYSLSAVCFRWRQVIWTSPSLWTSLFLNSTQPGVWEHFDLHCRNAKDASLAICLSTHHGFKAPLNGVLQLLTAVLTKCTDKVQSLDLGPIDKTVWECISSYAISADFPRLETLKLNFKRSFDAMFGEVLFYRSPRLRKVEIGEALPGIEYHLPFQQLTSLVLKKPNPAHALSLLAHCPNLVNFRSEGVSTCGMGGTSSLLMQTPIILRDLQSFRWDSGECPAGATFISDIHLPSVHQLCWLGPLDLATIRIWKPFFSNMSTVKVLDCTYSAGLLALLDSLPSLEIVHIKFDLFFGCLGEIAEVMSQLEWKEEVGKLPRLVELTVTLEDQSKVVSKERLPFHNAMIQTLESRRLGPEGSSHVRLRKFTLNFAVLAIWGTWQRCLINSLKQLDRHGLDVTIM